MADSDLAILITAKSEALEVEYKSWFDTSMIETKAKLARHLAALSNHGGGYLVFGVDDKTKLPLGKTELNATLFGDDAISAIIKRYLDPRFQCRVERVSHDGVEYPVVVVPSHGARPVIAIADGPADERGQPIGIREGTIYIRSAGPESVAIRRPDDWTTLLERCLTHRSDLLANIMRQAIGKPSKPSSQVIDFLHSACQATTDSFIEQIRAAAVNLLPESDKQHLLNMAENFAVLGYALVGEDGELVSIENPRSVNSRVSVGMHQYAYSGWSAFLPLHVPERAPQLRIEQLLGRDQTFLEGMRIASNAFLQAAFDYWRIYEVGVCCSAESYHEDKWPLPSRGLAIRSCLVKLHSVLAHARLLGQETPQLSKIVLHMEWRGLAGRRLLWDEHRVVSPAIFVDNRFVKTNTIGWGELRDDYFAALRRICVPFFSQFDSEGWFDADTWFTRDVVERQLSTIGASMQLLKP